MKKILLFIVLFTAVGFSQIVRQPMLSDSLRKAEITIGDSLGRFWDSTKTASVELNNLGTTAINTHLIPSIDSTHQIGSSPLRWHSVWAKYLVTGTFPNAAQIYAPTLTASRIFTLPNASGTIPVGTGTANQIPYWVGTNTLGSLTTGTYPSLTELSYVKGLTSSAQTQLNAKGTVTVDDSLASDIADLSGIYQAIDSDLDNPDIPLDEISDSLLLYLQIADSTIYATQYDLTQVEGSLDSSIVNDLIGTYLDTLASDTSTHTLAQIDSAVTALEGGTAAQVLTKISGTDYDYGWSTAAALTAAQTTQIGMTWAYLALDTTATVSSIVDSTDATVSTNTSSPIFGVSANDVVRVSVDSARYKVKYRDQVDDSVWTDWLTAEAFYRNVDSAQVQHISSADNSTETIQIFYVGADVDTFSVTTVAGGFTRESLNPVLVLSSNDTDSIVKSGSNTIVSITNNGWTFTEADTSNGAPVLTDSSMYFSATGTKQLSMADAPGNPFDFGLNDFSIEGWFYFNSATAVILSKNDGSPDWVFRTTFGEYYMINFRAATVGETYVGQINSVDNAAGDVAGEWRYIAYVWDRDTGAYLYVDGLVVATEETTEWTDMSATDFNESGLLRFGADNLGHVNVIAVYHSALSSGDITNLYNLGRD